MQGNRTFRSMLAVAVAIALMSLCGCAGGVAEKREAAEAEPEEAIPIEELYSRADQAYQDGQHLEAYELYRQLIWREEALSAGQMRTVHSRFDELKEILREHHERAEKQQEATESLEEIAALCDEGKFEEASAKIDALREKGLEQLLSEEQKRKLDQCAERAGRAALAEEQKEATALFEEIAALTKEKKFQEARGKLGVLMSRGLQEQLTPQRKKQLDLYRRQIALAAEEFGLLTEEERLELAEDAFEKGMTAYRMDKYAEAQPLLEKAAQMDVSLGWWDNWSLSSARRKVRSTLDELRSRYANGEQLYEKGDFQGAKKELLAIRESGIDCGPEIMQGVEKYLTDIDVKAEAKAVEAAKQFKDQIATLAQQREKLLEARRLEARTAKEIKSKRAQANMRWQARDFEEAKSLYASIRELLKKVDVQKDPQLVEASKESESRLAVVDARIEEMRKEQERKEAALEKVSALLGEVEKLLPESLLEAEKKAQEAVNLARREGVALPAEQQELCRRVFAAVERRYGRQRRERRERFLVLMGESDFYLKTGEYQHARDALRLIEEAPELGLSADQRKRLDGKIVVAEKRLTDQKRLLDAARKLESEGDALLAEDRASEAAARLGDAVRIAREEGLPTDVRIELLEKYEGALAKAIPRIVSERTERLKAPLAERLEALRVLRPYRLALYYLKRGSPDLAKPLLEEVAADKDRFGAQRVERAQKELKGIEARIENLQKRELLAAQDQLARLLELEKEFQQKVKEADQEELQRLLSAIADATVRLHADRIERLLARGGHQQAVELLSEVALEDASEEVVEDVYEPLARRLKAWQHAGRLLSEAEEALGQWKLDEAAAALAKMDALEADLGPLTVTEASLKRILPDARTVTKTEDAIRQQQTASLQDARAALARSRQRLAAYESYRQAREPFLAAQWEKALETLRKLRAEPAGLHEFERDGVERMYALCDRVVSDRESAVAEARKTLQAAQADFDSRRYLPASEKLDTLAQMMGFQWDESLAPKANALAEKIAQKEKEAEELCQAALKAQEAKDMEKLAEALGQLRANYSATTTAQGQVAQGLFAQYEGLLEELEQEIKQAEDLLSRARDDFAAKRYAAALQAIETLRQTTAYERYEKMAAEAESLAEKIAQVEKEAQQLYQTAVQAHQAKDIEKLQKLLRQLERDYRYTETYRTHM